jgi:hypothetical protein
MGGTQTTAKCHNTGIASPSVAFIDHIPHKGNQFIGDVADPILVAASTPERITGLIRPGFGIYGVNGKNHDLTGFQPGTPGFVHLKSFEVAEMAILTGNEENRFAGVSIDVTLHVPAQRLTEVFKILDFHMKYLQGLFYFV